MTQSNQKPSNKNLKRASVPGAGGSITVEAALSVPIFFFAVVCLIYFIEIHNVQSLNNGLSSLIYNLSFFSPNLEMLDISRCQSNVT